MAKTPEAWKHEAAEETRQEETEMPGKKDVRMTFYFDRKAADALRELRLRGLRRGQDTSMSKILREMILRELAAGEAE